MIGDQSWHFNTNWGTTNRNDSRRINSKQSIAKAKEYFNSAKNAKGNERDKNIKKGLKELGKSLHPIQDIYAHTKNVCYYTTHKMYYRDQYHYITIKFWKHNKTAVINGKTVVVDSAKDRKKDIESVASETKNILRQIINSYSFLKK